MSSPRHLPPLRDRLDYGLRVMFVGINPGIRSAETGHHFAGFSNRFWKLLYDGGLVPEPVTYLDDDRLPEWGLGVTNLVPRATRGIDELRVEEYRAGRAALERKIRRFQPGMVALVGITLARVLSTVDHPRAARGVRGVEMDASPSVGLQPWTLATRPVFVLPNPSGRNAHYSYSRMLALFKELNASAPAAG
jgi:double-stranded uracil-DNA glycosylase